MICYVKNRNLFCKKVYMDVWGYYRIYRKLDFTTRFFKYLHDQKEQRKFFLKNEFSFSLGRKIAFERKKRLKDRYLWPRLLKNYYLTLSWRNMNQYYKIARKKVGNFINNFLMLLEGRLFMIVYRANWINNLFMIKNILEADIFYINGKVRSHCNYHLKFRDILTIHKDFIEFFKNDLLLRINEGKVIWSAPNYLYINYIFFFIFIMHKPVLSDMVHPFKVNWRVFWITEYLL